jgi:hypothetical protein
MAKTAAEKHSTASFGYQAGMWLAAGKFRSDVDVQVAGQQ